MLPVEVRTHLWAWFPAWPVAPERSKPAFVGFPVTAQNRTCERLGQQQMAFAASKGNRGGRLAAAHDGTVLSEKPMTQPDGWRMVAGAQPLPSIAEAIGNHTFRAPSMTNSRVESGRSNSRPRTPFAASDRPRSQSNRPASSLAKQHDAGRSCGRRRPPWTLRPPA